MKNVINWFEIPAVDFDRTCKFYTDVFGAELQRAELGGFQLGMFPTEGGVGGAVVHGEGYLPGDHGSMVYFDGGDDLQNFLDKVEPAGGTVLMPKMLIAEGIGYAAIFLDPEGNKVGLHSTN